MNKKLYVGILGVGLLSIFTVVIGILIGLLLGYILFQVDDSNSKLIYGDTGYPKNCRAIIKENYEGWYLEEFRAEDALDSINRNCGEFGYSWTD